MGEWLDICHKLKQLDILDVHFIRLELVAIELIIRSRWIQGSAPVIGLPFGI